MRANISIQIFTYVMDSLIFRLASASRLILLDQTSTRKGLYRVSFAFLCVLLLVYEDYRLNPKGLLFAFVAFLLVSISKLIPRIGLRIEKGLVHTWDCALYVYLLIGIPPMIIMSVAAFRFEDVGSAFHMALSWDSWKLLLSLVPGALLLIIFNSSMNMAAPFSAEGVPAALEDSSSQAATAITTTLQASFWVTCLGVILGEKTFVDWVQALAYAFFYVIGAGPKQIGFYPPRLMNLIARVLRKPQQKISAEPWQLPFFPWITISIFVALVSSSLLYFNVNVAYTRDSKNWTGPKSPFLDSGYVPPQPYLLDIIIAHSDSDPVQSITDLISSFATLEFIQPNHPRVKIYTKDQSLNATGFANYTGSFTGPLTSTVLHNTGGIAATFIHHILYSWDFLPSQTLFLSTSSPDLSHTKARFNDYFIPTLPVHSTRPSQLVTSFLSLGDYETCHCGSCSDSLGWHDTFHLIPSMWGAARPKSEACKSVLLTYGNNFVVSADRIRGLGQDVWQMLYDALVNPDTRNSWAHDAEKLPNYREGGKRKFGEEDSLENPYLGYTIERLWGILLQCSSQEVAWRCPNVLRGWRRDGGTGDCGCLHW